MLAQPDDQPEASMWIMVSGPYENAEDETARGPQLGALNRAALALFRAGHVPIVGVNLARPIARLAAEDPEPLTRRLALAAIERCDACLRIGGESDSADADTARFQLLGRPVYTRLEDVPPATD
jgi:hypothetical protein